jgi:hypothetical protein
LLYCLVKSIKATAISAASHNLHFEA